jgi:hypothetical protein
MAAILSASQFEQSFVDAANRATAIRFDVTDVDSGTKRKITAMLANRKAIAASVSRHPDSDSRARPPAPLGVRTSRQPV